VGSVLASLPDGSRVAVVRLRSLGDCVLTTPALDILRRARPDLRIAIVVEDRFRTLFENNPDVDAILPPSLGALRKWRPRLCLNLHGGTRSAWMTALCGARRRAGFGHFRHRWAYNLRIPRAQEILGEERTVHTAEHLASAMFWLGAPRCEIPRAKLMARPVVPGRAAPGNAAAGNVAPGNVAVIHAVAATPEKTWRADGFLAVAERVQSLGVEPVFIGASHDDLTPFRSFRTMKGAPLAEVKSLLAGASLFIGNDSGPAHMAAAFGLPVVVIFGNSNPAIWAPWRTPAETVTAPGGIAQVEIAQVLNALARLRVHA
jgi:ADP-heptose:LPS heptosyltransferase